MTTQKIAIFGSASLKPTATLYKEIEKIGEYLGKSGFDIVSGGYLGTMEAISKGGSLSSAKIIGVTCKELEKKFKEKKPNQYLTSIVITPTIEERILKIIKLGDAYTIFDGGSGTMYEWIKIYEYMNSKLMGEKSIIFFKPSVAVKNFINFLCSRERNKKYLFQIANSLEGYKKIINKIIA